MTTTSILIAGAVLTVPKIILTGVCLGVGFWAAKKITNEIDYRLALRDADIITILQNPYEKA